MGKTDIRFVDGFDAASQMPRYACDAGLVQRFAVIQDTYRPDLNGTAQDGMFFDEDLWLSLIDFARASAAEVRIGLTQKLGEEREVATFLAEWSRQPDKERDKPQCLRGRDDGVLSLVIAPVYWCSIGGPDPYHDSYTYEVYSAVPLGAAVMAHLAAANSGGWDLADAPIVAFRTEAEVPKSSLWQRLWGWLG